MDKNISFFSVLKSGYKDQPKKRLGKYILDEQLSNDNNQVYYNPKKNKTAMIITKVKPSLKVTSANTLELVSPNITC